MTDKQTIEPCMGCSALECYGVVDCDVAQRVLALHKTLTEIKEICNNNDELKGDFNLVDCDKYKLGKHNLANKILQKISECEGNDEM